MLAGVGAVDAALLVIAADDGVMPQTEEHAAILDLLNIRAGCVALTKIDRASKTRLEKIKNDARALLAGGDLADAPLFPVCNTDGAGIDRLANYLHKLLLAKQRRQRLAEERRFRFLIDRSFSVRGIGTVVTGSCREGEAAVGDSLLHDASGSGSAGGSGRGTGRGTGNAGNRESAGGKQSACGRQQKATTRLRGIRAHRQTREQLRRGERAALNITLEKESVGRGDWLLDPRLHQPIARFDASLRLLPGAAEPRPNTRYHLHIGASHQLATLRRLGASDYFQVKLGQTCHALHGDRFILRDPAARHTLGGGRVVDIFVPSRGRASGERLALLRAMDQDAETACRALTSLLADGLDLDRFSLSRNLGPAAVESLVDKMRQGPKACVALAMEAGEYPRLLSGEHYQRHRGALLAKIADYHRAHPDRQGVSAPQLLRGAGAPVPRTLLPALLARLLEESALARSGSLLHLPGHSTRLGEQVEQLLRQVRPILEKSGKVPPRTRELAERTGLPLASLQKILRQAEISNQLVKVADNRHYLPETIRELAALVEKLAGGADGKEGFSVIAFRDASGIGRNLCIEILEYFDGIGFTRREDNLRFLRRGRGGALPGETAKPAATA